ncbi:SpoIIE family protein phosphatase [Streptomyces sp. NBC_00554]|uniref:SpoIIE family protein phosphatase n=1 Tax=Streptomyces sp. NBC_00554 TaxID=2903661 RepID=UPI00352CB238|nr:SpoIIE family protein phosphatase [Streptomyces sp. NBC_00554]
MSESEPRATGPDTSAERVREARLRLLKTTDGLGNTEMLRLTLHQAVAELGGLGGMVHLSEAADPGLRLVAAVGLPRAFADAWEDLAPDETTAPVLAVRTCSFVWLRAEPGLRSRTLSEGTGLAAVPLPGPEGPIGALSVLMATLGEPDTDKRLFLQVLADRAAERLRQSPPAPSPVSPAWWQEPSGTRLQHAMRAVEVGVWDWDLRTGDLLMDEAALAMSGLDPDTFDGRIESWTAHVHPDDVPVLAAEVDKIIADRGVLSFEYRLCRPDGSISWIEDRGQLIFGEDGEPVRMIGTAWDTTQTRMARDSVGRALRNMSDGFFAVDADWHITYVNVQAERFFSAAGNLLGRVLWEAVPAASALGLEKRSRQAVADGTPVGFDIQSPATHAWYHMRLVPVPGGLTVYFTDVTEQRAHEAEHARAERAAVERAARMEELTRALAQALTVQDLVQAIADHVLPPFGATGLIIQAVEGERLRAVGAVGYPQEYIDRLARHRVAEVSPVAEVLRSLTPKFIASLEEFTQLYPELADYLTAGRKQAWAFLPLVASGRPVGCCLISFARPHRFTDEERTLFTALSGLIAQSFERARLYDAEHTRAQELQRGMLPRALPVLPTVTAAARYLPAGEGMEVGGDWYDVIPLSGARVALVIGDVMGHGLAEAVTMGRLRTAVHTLADLELPPDELLAHLNDLVSDLGDDFYATCLYAVYDPSTRVCTFAGAGHPPPAVVDPDGSVRFPRFTPDPPLGAAGPPFETVEFELPEGSLLVLYTDGLIESADRNIDDGMAHLARTLTAAVADLAQQPSSGSTTEKRRTGPDRRGNAAEDVSRVCDAVVSALLPAQEQSLDDAALLVARIHGLPAEDIVSWPLPEHPTAAGEARRHVREQLDQWHLDDLAMTTELLASELVGNVIRHAKGPCRLRLLRGQSLVCEVSDGSPTTPRIRRASDTDEGGRGLQLVAALSHRWGARYTATGKCIWTEQLLPEPPLDQPAYL